MDKQTHDYIIKTMAKDYRGKTNRADQMVYGMSCRNNRDFIAGKAGNLTSIGNAISRHVDRAKVQSYSDRM